MTTKTHTARLAALGLALVALNSCGASSKPAAVAPAATAAIRHTHENLNAVLWMQTAVEYQASTRQAYLAARLALDAALADPKWTAATEQTADPSSLPPAVILDLDETVFDNSPAQARVVADSTPTHGVGYDEKVWNDWVQERKSTAIPGAVEFLTYAVSRGVTPIYVSNRSVKMNAEDGKNLGEVATRDVLKQIGAPLDERTDTVLLIGEQGWNSSDKSPRRAFVASHYRIVMLVGDNFEDFVTPADKTLAGRAALAAKYSDWWGTRWIVLPNPTYGSWERAITQGTPSDDAAQLARKYGALRLAR